MALEARVGKKKAFSAVYVNRFGKHASGSVLAFEGKRTKQEEQQRSAARPPAAVRTRARSPEPGTKGPRRPKAAPFQPRAPPQSPASMLGVAAGTEIQMQNGNADVFRFPTSAVSDATNWKKKNADKFGKKRKVFRVIYKMLHENENLRTRLLNTSQKRTASLYQLILAHNTFVDIAAEMTTIIKKEKDSPEALDATPFGWV